MASEHLNRKTSNMKMRKLGSQGLEVSALGIGAMGLSAKAIDITLTPADLREIDAAASRIEIQGERLDAGLLT
jgi:hypothetical protein